MGGMGGGANPFAAFGGMGGGFPGIGGGMGGGAGGPDIAALLSNPMMQQMMTSMLSQPGELHTMMSQRQCFFI